MLEHVGSGLEPEGGQTPPSAEVENLEPLSGSGNREGEERALGGAEIAAIGSQHDHARVRQAHRGLKEDHPKGFRGEIRAAAGSLDVNAPQQAKDGDEEGGDGNVVLAVWSPWVAHCFGPWSILSRLHAEIND
ncbi:MAG: hypothetical protein AB1726_15300 [Planctomycetota bacterium]